MIVAASCYWKSRSPSPVTGNYAVANNGGKVIRLS